MPKVNIDLGYSMDDMMPEMDGDKEMHPSFTVHSDEKIDFPHEGEMTIKYKKVSSEDRKGHYTCQIEVRKIVSMYGDKDAPYKRDKSAEEALDDLAAKRMKEREEDEEDDEY